MTVYRTRRSGFTLVEILIVVIILGILAAIVIPQFTNASQDARKNSLASQLQTLRSQIQLYKLQHLDKPPVLTNTWDVFLYCTDKDGNVSPTQQVVPDTSYPFGPYMQAIPINPLTGSGNIAALGSPAANVGWTYDAASGTIHGVAVDGSGTAVETDDGVQDINGNLIQY